MFQNPRHPRKLQNVVPFLMSMLGIYVLSVGIIVSVVFGRKLFENLSFFLLHGSGTASVVYGVAGTLLLGNQFEPPIHDFYTAAYYTFVILTTFLKTMKSMNIPIVVIARDLKLATSLKSEGYKFTAIVNSSKNAEKLEDFCEEIIDVSHVLNNYLMNKNRECIK